MARFDQLPTEDDFEQKTLASAVPDVAGEEQGKFSELPDDSPPAVMNLRRGLDRTFTIAEQKGVDPESVKFALQRPEREMLVLAGGDDDAIPSPVVPTSGNLSALVDPDVDFEVSQFRQNVRHLGRQIWSGLMRGEASLFTTLDNAAELVSGVTGTDKIGVFEFFKENAEQMIVDSESFTDVLNQGIFALPGILAEFQLAKGAGTIANINRSSRGFQIAGKAAEKVGLAGVGALSRADEGPVGAAKGALEFLFFDSFSRATAGLPLAERAAVGAGTFGSLSAAAGEGPEEIAANAALGVFLSATQGRGDGRVSLKEGFKKQVREFVRKRVDKTTDPARAKRVGVNAGLAYLRKHHPDIARKIEVMDIGMEAGKPRLNPNRYNDVLGEMDKILTQRLGLNRETAARTNIRDKMNLLLDRVDPKGRIAPDVRRNLVDQSVNQLFEAQRLSKDFFGPRSPQAKAEASGEPKPPPASKIPRLERGDAIKFNRAQESTRKEIRNLEKRMRRSVIERTRTAVINPDANLRKELLKRGGKTGEAAVMMHDLIQGAIPRAQHRFQEFEANIYRGLNRQERAMLDDMIHARRVLQVDQIHGEGRIRHSGGVKGSDSIRWMENLKQRNPKTYERLLERSDRYFEATNEMLGLMRKEGLISEALFQKLKNFNYRETQFLNFIDPIRTIEIGGRKISVRDSGIFEQQRGSGEAAIIDSRELLAQLTGRVMNRIARNNANKALFRLAKEIPENGLVKIPKAERVEAAREAKTGRVKELRTPGGFTRLNVLIDGKQQPIFMDSKMALEWIASSPQMTRAMASFLRTVSGSLFVRPLATGYNPGFILTNLPRDIVHIHLSTGEYSSFVPLYAGQMSRDMLTVAKDAILRRGRWKQYIEEGGGMSFLAHQGRDVFVGERPLLKELHPDLKRIKGTLGYLNELSEIWTRLALRERAIRNGKTPQEATWTARNYLDFAQGGTIAKGVDHVFPYFNASLQAVRGVGRRAKQAPAEFAWKASQYAALTGLIWYANRMTNQEAFDDISQKTKDSNFIITSGLPPIIDDQGNLRHVYFTVKKDNTLVPLTMMTEMAMERYVDGRVPDRTRWELLGTALESLAIVPGGIPIIDATRSYAANYDFWFDDEIWRGAEVPPEEEFLTPAQSTNPTNPFFVAIGQQGADLGFPVSPARLERASGSIFPNNTFTGLFGQGFKSIFGDEPQTELAKTTEEILADAPFIRRTMKLTHPAANRMDRLEKVQREGAGERAGLDRKLDELLVQFRRGEIGKESVRDFIRAAPVDEQERLAENFQSDLAVRKVFNRFTQEGVPPATWWKAASTLPPRERAAVFHDEQQRADPSAREKMDRIAEALSRGDTGIGFASQDFREFLRLERGLYGSRAEDRTSGRRENE